MSEKKYFFRTLPVSIFLILSFVFIILSSGCMTDAPVQKTYNESEEATASKSEGKTD